jgi:hypothetical protein
MSKGFILASEEKRRTGVWIKRIPYTLSAFCIPTPVVLDVPATISTLNDHDVTRILPVSGKVTRDVMVAHGIERIMATPPVKFGIPKLFVHDDFLRYQIAGIPAGNDTAIGMAFPSITL